MKRAIAAPKKRLLTTALLLALAQPAFAQDAPAAQPAQDPATSADDQRKPDDSKLLDTINVVGIAGSLTSSMNMKRDGQGVVDGIVAEDIGKFPDTNLAESLQRISGVSIDRTASGEGSKVTVRGIGPDYNMVLLNGRQMPGALLNGFDVSNSRAFDFANLASEAVSAVEVYKTGRASNPTGGIGATINIRTARPLDAGNLANIGVKTVFDTSNDNLPKSFGGKDFTPELSGIFSHTFADGTFGIALTGSYQERESGYSQASASSGWRTMWGDEGNWGALPPAGDPSVENHPGPNDLYSVPQAFGYTVNSVHRQRTNGQVTLQWAPTDNLTATLDYTYSENKIQQRRNEMSVWFNFTGGSSAWTDGPAAGPIFYTENINCTDQQNAQGVYNTCGDLAVGGAKGATRAQNKSVGFNVDWAVTDALDLAFDYHDSSAEIGPDSDWGTDGTIGVAANMRGNTTVHFNNGLPLLNLVLNPAVGGVDPSQARPSGRRYVNGYSRSDVEQAQLDGKFKFGDYSDIQFGASNTQVDNRTALGILEYADWGTPIGSTSDWDDGIWTLDDMSNYFDAFSGHNDPRWTSTFLVTDLDRLRDALGAWGDQTTYPADYNRNDLRTTEKTRSAYLQYNTEWDARIPVKLSLGVRYEKTEVTSSAQVVTPDAIQWNAPNELQAIMGDKQFTTIKGDYQYWLPELDTRFDLTDDMVLRASYGYSIGRPGWKDIQGGLVVNTNVRVNGGTASAGNPGLKPLLSKNFDLSYEWYFAEGSYFSAGYYRKNISNYIDNGAGSYQDTLFSLPTPIGGAYWTAATTTGGCSTSDGQCIRDYIFANFDGQPGVDSTAGTAGVISGIPGDPLTVFSVTTPANAGSHSLNGFELNLQYMFGQSGFGVTTNYTIVRSSGLRYDNGAKGPQQVLFGLSDSANVVGFYDKGPWQIRLAYNWRDKFLNSQYDGDPGDIAHNNPVYVEPYRQWDMSVGYKFSDRFTLQFEGINLTDETQRLSERNGNILFQATQTGPRYMLGLRYNFQ